MLWKSLESISSFSSQNINSKVSSWGAPVPLLYSKPAFGYVFKHGGHSIAYHSLDLMVIDCSFIPESVEMGHNNLNDVLEIDARAQPKRELPLHIVIDRDEMPVFPFTG